MDSDPSSVPAPSPKPAVLAYETANQPILAGSRPGWVYAVFMIYGLGALGLLSLPVWANWVLNENVFFQAAVCVGCLVACGASLMILPVRMARRRPITRKSIWIPIIASGLLAGSLLFGAGLALYEYFRVTGDSANWALIIGSLGVWAGWAVVFAMIAYSRDPQGIGLKLHRTLFAGSVLELLVAVPTHVIVRRRPECCAGIMTGMGICIGVTVMFVSFGPSVMLLFYRRRRQISPMTPPRMQVDR